MIQALKSNQNLTHVGKKTVCSWSQVLGTSHGGEAVQMLQALVACRCRGRSCFFNQSPCFFLLCVF